MAKDKLTEYSATNASNDVIGDISVAEGMLPSAVNNALREQMTHLKNFSDGTDAIDALAVDNLKLDGNTISSTDTNGNVTIDPNGTGNTIIASGATVQTASTSTSAFDFGVQVNNSYASNDSISAIGFHNRADVNATGVGGAIAYVGGGASAGSGNITFNIKDGSDIANVVDVADEKMRIDSNGRIYSGTTSAIDGSRLNVYSPNNGTGIGVSASGASYSHLYCKDLDGGTGTHYILWIDNVVGSNVGKITHNGSSTSYQTTSDYRLKESVVADWDATTRLKQLNPVRFNFIVDPDTTVDGFLAHEVQSVVPEAISGTKDAMMDEEYEVSAATGDIYTPAIDAVLDEDDNEVTPAVAEVIHSTDAERPEELAEGQQWRETTAAVMGARSVPDYQGIDQSKLTPLLTKALIEAVEKIEQLETRIAALEA